MYQYHRFPKNIKQQLFSALIIIGNVSWAAIQHIRMNAEGSCDTEDWSNVFENKTVVLNDNNIPYGCFYYILIK